MFQVYIIMTMSVLFHYGILKIENIIVAIIEEEYYIEKNHKCHYRSKNLWHSSWHIQALHLAATYSKKEIKLI